MSIAAKIVKSNILASLVIFEIFVSSCASKTEKSLINKIQSN